MEWIFVLALGAIVAMLWQRLERAERRLEDMALRLDEVSERLFASASPVHSKEPSAVSPRSDPVPHRPTVPVVRVSRREDTAPLEKAIPISSEEAPQPVFSESDETDAPARRFGFDFDLEDIFGRRLPIWAGGIALAVAGVFLVRYSIDSGLLTPQVRVIFAFLFGLALLGGAEAAYRWRERVADPRVAQALAGAGLATLYAAFYLAGTQYGLLGQSAAFLGLAGVTGGAIALSYRFGLPCAVLGLVGGFAAPALIGGDASNLPLLALYLGLVTTGLTVSGRRQGRPWMGIAALVGGLGWGALLLLSGDPGFAEILALGLYFIVLGAVLPAIAGNTLWQRPLRLGSAFVASLQLALLVDQGGYSPLAWGLYLLMGATLAFFAWRRSVMREACSIATAIAVILLAQWDGATPAAFAVVALAIALVFGAVPLLHVWRADFRKVDLGQLCGTALGLAVVSYGTFGSYSADVPEPVLAIATLVLSALPAAAAYRLWRAAHGPLVSAMSTTAVLVFAALLMITPAWSAPISAALVFAGLFGLLRGRTEVPFEALLWAAASIGAGSLAVTSGRGEEFLQLVGAGTDSLAVHDFARWAAVAAAFATLAMRNAPVALNRLAECLATVLTYGMLAQLMPADALPWTAAIAAVAVRFVLPLRTAAQACALAIAGLWTLATLGVWIGTGLASLTGAPVFVGELPTVTQAAVRLLPFCIALLIVRPSRPAGLPDWFRLKWLALPIAIVIGHILYKQIFAIDTLSRFIEFGMAERTLWQGLLLGSAWLAASRADRIAVGLGKRAAVALAGLSLAHFCLYTGLLHNPLWDRQAVGPVPLANLALAAYAIAIASAVSLRLWLGERVRILFDALVMAIASVGALTLLRQAFAGSIPALPSLSQAEDLLRSLLGILLAIFFLMLGSRLRERSWRLGSLVLMLLAVAKVFIVDAAGLEGLLRIASFMALGFSLIGIGWVYSRQLRSRPEFEKQGLPDKP